MRARRVAAAKSDAFKLTRRGQVLWRDEEIACLEAGDNPLRPVVTVSADEHLSAPDKEKVQERLMAWVAELIGERLKPLVDLAGTKDISGLARGIAFRLSEGFGTLRREAVAEELRALDQPARAQLRNYGVRFGAFNIYFPVMLKPASGELALVLWVLKNGAARGLDVTALPEPPRPGLTSFIADKALPEDFYRVAGFHVCGTRAVRIDMLERLADQIRLLVAWRPDPANQTLSLKGATGDGGFRATPEMMSILGCSAGELGNVLQALGFRLDRVRLPQPAVEPTADAAVVPIAEAGAAEEVASARAPVPEEPRDGDPPSPPATATPVGEPPVADLAIPSQADDPAAVKWDEIWRPRRQGRRIRRSERRDPAPSKPPEKDARRSKPDKDRRERHRERPAKRRDDRPQPHMQSAAPAPKAGGDPDSPFAALRSLKAAMEKATQG